MRKLSILVVLVLLCVGFASFSSKVKEIGEHMKERAQDILGTTKDKAHAAKDFMSAKAFEAKADVRDAFHGAKESASSTKDSLKDKSQSTLDSIKEKAKAGKDAASSKFHEIKADVKDAASKAKGGSAKLRTGVSSITLVLLSLIFGVLFFMSFGQGAGVDKMKGKFFEARGKAKGAIDSTVNRAKAGYYDAKAKARESANREH
jgi:F0F1-type ATP synthase membrane subunit b/b'